MGKCPDTVLRTVCSPDYNEATLRIEDHVNVSAAKNLQQKEQLQRQIEATDRQIDQLVYQLYNLTADEIRIVEETTT